MARLTTITFSRDDLRYEIAIDLDDAAIVRNRLSFQVTASVTNERGRRHQETLLLEVDLAEGLGKIYGPDQNDPWYEFRLDAVPVLIEAGVEAVPIEGFDGVANFIHEGIGHRIAELIDLMPAPDPILGCALKAGISSILGQTLACNEIVGREGGLRQRVREIVRCLREHVGGIFTRALWRAARCMVTLGW